MTKEEAQKVIQENMSKVEILLRECEELGKEHRIRFTLLSKDLRLPFQVPYSDREWSVYDDGFAWVPSQNC